MKRIFILKASTATTSPDFLLRNVAGTSGRLDVVCRCILSAFRVDGAIRRDVDFYAVLEGPPRPGMVLSILGSHLKSLPKSEVDVASIIKDLLVVGEGGHPGYPAFRIAKGDFERLILGLAKNGIKLLYLHERGVAIEKLEFELGGQYGFILGDHLGLDPNSERFLDSIGVGRVSLGPISYLASHCITIVHEELDRRVKSSP
ncbi:MAG: tRNA (pseudouridine(54)-N(1))-methyltransferase TrmY [Candidatus Methanomethylicota archaeon]|uniref:tRNA (pseudouridine(54)-N(1))-methyltransferase n=1 Tax=Thermoproteota archaeon TaxID=2056631 RepID=A0A497F5R9_9CREN|nr:MAG: tRNA (pseudouridine(54)-N(1))-methyltransferase TrmY [Candidatus Verstraetearchaeota archaeon]